jgi:hypothetical protein
VDETVHVEAGRIQWMVCSKQLMSLFVFRLSLDIFSSEEKKAKVSA